MKAIQIAHTGGPESIDLVDLERPAPAPIQALVEIHAIGVNFIDIYYREGVYPSILPLTLGQEAAGVVVGVEITPNTSASAIGWPGVLSGARMRSTRLFRNPTWFTFPPGSRSNRQRRACFKA